MKQNILIEVICFLLILLFVYAAISKLFDYSSFKYQVHLSPFLSSFSNFAWIIPAIELIIAMLLIFNTWRMIGLYASFFMMLSFTLYITLMLLFTKHLPCSCGGVLRKLSWPQHLILNIFFLILAIAGIILQKNKHLKILLSNNLRGTPLNGISIF